MGLSAFGRPARSVILKTTNVGSFGLTIGMSVVILWPLEGQCYLLRLADGIASIW